MACPAPRRSNLLRSTGTPSLIADALDKAGSGVTGVDEALQMSAV
jgi:hypothetical protein